jgi:hypothetical protein
LAKDEDDGGVVEKMWEPLIQHSHWPQGSSTLATNFRLTMKEREMKMFW